VLVVPHSRRRKAERLIMDAKIKPQWMDPPTADAIRLLDRERFLSDPLLAEEVTDEDRAMADLLLTTKSPNDIAALLAKLYRSRLPEPEEISEPEPMHAPRGERSYTRDREFDDKRSRERVARPRNDRFERQPEPLRAAPDSVIFSMDVGRRQKADPKWLLPMICRRGNVSRNEIGTIRILDDTTEFEISKEAAEHFAVHARRKDGDDIIIALASEAKARPERPATQNKFRDAKPFGEKKPFRKKSFEPRGDQRPDPAPRAERPAYQAERPPGEDRLKKPFVKPAPKGFGKGPKAISRSGFAHRKGKKG
jgi:ATP-dependent RNA helicase DeaD